MKTCEICKLIVIDEEDDREVCRMCIEDELIKGEKI